MHEVDLFRETWVRYLGYANEVGEAFRPVVPKFVVYTTYKIAFAYVVGDTFSKSWQALKREANPKKVMITAGDAFIWQTIASVVIPGFTINRICAWSGFLLCRYAKGIPPRLRSGLTVAIGLASIPIIIHPIDAATTVFMDATYRKYFRV